MKQAISFLFLFLFCVIGKAQDIGPLLKSSWYQEAPFNNYIPSHVKAGCGPIAVAQILNYYQAPTQGFGHVTLYNDLDYSGKTIDYSLILNDYRNNNYTSEQADAVANLVWHVGAAMTLKYPNNGTENNRMIWGIQKYLHINQKCRFRLRKFYSTEQWVEMLDKQLEEGHPVYYRGRAFRYNSDPSGIGHIYIIDGKNAEGMYHANFGKSTAEYNKYVSLDVLDQSMNEGTYPGDYGIYYNWEQGMATDLYPDEYFNEDTFNDYPVYLAEPLTLNNDKSLDELKIPLDKAFYLSTKLQVYTGDYIKAKDGSIGTWQQALGVYKDEQLISVIQSKQNHSFSTSSTKSSTLPYEIPSSISNGEYEIRVVTKRADSDLWQPVWDIAPNTISIIIKEGTVTLRTKGNHTLSTKLYLLDSIQNAGDVNSGYSGRLFSLKIKNPTDNNFENKIKLSVVVDNVVKANLEQMASVYSGCQVEYRFLIPYEVFDFRTASKYKIKASYYEQNELAYLDLTTDIPDLSDINLPNKNVYPHKCSVYSINGLLIKHMEDSDIDQIEDLPRGCYIIKEEGRTRKILR